MHRGCRQQFSELSQPSECPWSAGVCMGPVHRAGCARYDFTMNMFYPEGKGNCVAKFNFLKLVEETRKVHQKVTIYTSHQGEGHYISTTM